MLVCGCVNPPPVTDPAYHCVYFSLADDLAGKARDMRDTPLRIEHCAGTDVGKVLSAWTAGDGRMYALAEVDTRTAGGAVAASYVRTGCLGEFSLGWRLALERRVLLMLAAHTPKPGGGAPRAGIAGLPC